MASWSPPKNGTPCWVQIVADDVLRAKEFYRKVFDWNFQPATEKYPEDRIAMFGYPDEKLKSLLGGGITKRKEGQSIQTQPGNVVYHYVDDIEAMITKITEAGGKAIGEKEQESDAGFMHHFEDTEGNYGGIYTVNNKNK